uniref:Uncharacterized protein n=1 Tax=Arion vulgaris TaxID=1028688 RepID=A0A0B7AJN8_9EUPU
MEMDRIWEISPMGEEKTMPEITIMSHIRHEYKSVVSATISVDLIQGSVCAKGNLFLDIIFPSVLLSITISYPRHKPFQNVL